jgi:hypothetical protein
MNEHEELLAKAWACLSEAPKIQDPAVRAKVLELVYHTQQVAQAALLRDLDGSQSIPKALADGASFASPTNPKSTG